MNKLKKLRQLQLAQFCLEMNITQQDVYKTWTEDRAHEIIEDSDPRDLANLLRSGGLTFNDFLEMLESETLETCRQLAEVTQERLIMEGEERAIGGPQ